VQVELRQPKVAVRLDDETDFLVPGFQMRRHRVNYILTCAFRRRGRGGDPNRSPCSIRRLPSHWDLGCNCDGRAGDRAAVRRERAAIGSPVAAR
jgi:hypothetical protein